MQLFTVTIGPRQAPRLQFQAMAPDSATAAAQHMDLAQGDERVEITPAQRMRAELQDLAGSLKPSADTLRLQRRAPVVASAPIPDAGSYGRLRSCSLCGDPCGSEVCTRCAPSTRSL